MITRRPLLLGTLAAIAACKRTRAPKVTEVWDEEPVPEQADAIGALAPPWPAPVRGQLDSGLLTFWLHEVGTSASHVRLVIPTLRRAGDAPPAAAIAVVAEYIRAEWQHRTLKHGVAVRLEHGPDRFEITASGTESKLTNTLAALGSLLASRAPNGLEGQRARLENDAAARTSAELATAATIAKLLGTHDALDREALRELSRVELGELWPTMTDPRDAVLIVQSSRTAEEAKPELRRLATAWRGTGRRELLDQAAARLHRNASPKSTGTRLLSAPVTAVEVVEGTSRGPGVLALGRTLSLDKTRDRSLARLAQRIAQEELDMSLTIAGKVGVVVVRTTITKSAPDRDLQRAVEQVAAFAQTRQPRQRLFQAAQLWLGARVVEASLAGEDWTGLFAKAIDLSDRDAEIAGALAKDAKTMLALGPEELHTWTKKWLDPRVGEPGWAWSAAGLDADTAAKIGKVAQVS
ncbi:MAG TPA: hypothetical protein VG755_13475 [Nannocystaceae bacterium]|nr:hypothetical protein [Nannocystaceae bacterium]